MKLRSTLLTLVFVLLLIPVINAQNPAPASETKTTTADPASVIVAKIGEDSITLAQLDEKVDGLLNKFREISPGIEIPHERRVSLRQNFLDRMVREHVLELHAKKANLTVTDDEVNERITQLQSIFGEGDEARRTFLGGIKDMKQFREDIAKQIVIQKWMDSQLNDKVTVTEEELKAYYTGNSDKFIEPEMVKARQAVWKLPPAESKEFAEKKAAAEKSAMSVVQKVSTGADFKETMVKLTVDPNAGILYSDDMWVPRKKLSKELEDALFDLHPGEMTKPLESPMGIVLLQMVEYQKSKTLSFEDSKDRIRKILEGKQKSSLQENMYMELKAKTPIEIFTDRIK